MEMFDLLMDDTANGYGYWPNPQGRWAFSMGPTMKGLRAWAQMQDARR